MAKCKTSNTATATYLFCFIFLTASSCRALSLVSLRPTYQPSAYVYTWKARHSQELPFPNLLHLDLAQACIPHGRCHPSGEDLGTAGFFYSTGPGQQRQSIGRLSALHHTQTGEELRWVAGKVFYKGPENTTLGSLCLLYSHPSAKWIPKWIFPESGLFCLGLAFRLNSFQN